MGTVLPKEEIEGASVNSIDEIQFLNGHTDIARYLIQIDSLRIASGSDDGKVIIWNLFNGEKLYTLKGHSSPITCMLILSVQESSTKVKEKKLLVTGSRDKTVRIWDIYRGVCLSTLTSHKGSVTCLVNMSLSSFCSAGNDSQIIFWHYDGTVIGKIERNEEENLHCLIGISHNRIVTGSNSTLLFVYNSKDFTFEKCLSFHKDSVRCLINIDERSFASGSIDGSIAIWNSETLHSVKILHNPELYFSGNLKTYLYNVGKLTLLPNGFLAAAIGTGFKIFNLDNGSCFLNCTKAHNGEVTAIISSYHTSRIITCSSDHSIKIWGFGPNPSPFFSNKIPDSFIMKRYSQTKQGEVTPICIGEMWVHSESVNDIIGLSEYEFVSCGGDGLVVLWKDGRIQTELRNIYGSEVMGSSSKFSVDIGDFDDFEEFGASVFPALNSNVIIDEYTDENNSNILNTVINSTSISSPSTSHSININNYNNSNSPSSSVSATFQINLDNNSNISPVKREGGNRDIAVCNGGDFSSAKLTSTLIPEYIIDYALFLKTDKRLNIFQICDDLKNRGHSEFIVSSVKKRLETVK